MTRHTKLLSLLLAALLLAVFAMAAYSQTSAQNPTPTPPDRKAYSDAGALRDADKKIEAMEKFINDFPDSTYVASAYQSIFDALVKNHPEQTSRIRETAGKAIEKSANPQSKAAMYSTVATQLCDADILMSDAENMAVRGMSLVEEEAARIAANPPPAAPANANARGNAGGRPAANPMANVNRLKSSFQVALGRIYIKQGKLEAAEKNLKEALSVNPQLTAASLGLAEIYEKRGDTQSALTTYINAAAVSKIPAGARRALNGLYAKTHKGSLAGLEDMLDARYHEANPAPFEVEPYKPAGTRTDRIVLTEVFTGSGCPPCVAADLAADLTMERFSNKEQVVIMYHQHIPQPDPMTTPQTTARFKYYAGTGVPTMVIDGATSPGGGGARDATKRVYDRILPVIEKKLSMPADARLRVNASLKGNMVKAGVVVDNVTKGSPDLKLHILLVEQTLRYTGENGVRLHPMVVRSMAGAEGTGLPLAGKKSETLDWDFDVAAISAGIKKHLDEYEAGGHRGNKFTFTEKKFEINPKDLLVVAFVQDEKTKEILQSAVLKIK